MADIKAAPQHVASDIEVEKHDVDIEQVEIEKAADISLEGAIAAELGEQSMTFREAIRDYRAAVFWSFAISLCIIMEGYDTALPVCPLFVSSRCADCAGQLCRHSRLSSPLWSLCQRRSRLPAHTCVAVWSRPVL